MADELNQQILEALQGLPTKIADELSQRDGDRKTTSDKKVNQKSFVSGGSVAEKFGKTLDVAGGSVSDAFNNVSDIVKKSGLSFGLLDTALGSAAAGVEYLEETNNTFQQLSKVGAGFNGDLGALRGAAADARLPLGVFADMVSKNAQQLAGFSGGVEGGAKRVAQLGKAMFETGAIDGFMNLGYSIEEANEFLVENTELIRRQSRLTGMSAEQEVMAAQNLAKQLDVVAKLTGQDAKAQKDELIARQRAGATQARLRLLEMDGVKNAQEAYTAAQTKLEQGPEVLQNLFDDIVQTGVPMTEATKNFAATNKAAYDLAMQAKAALDRGDTAEAERLAQEAVAATAEQAKSRQGLTLATLSQVSDVAQGQATVLEETGPLIDAIQARAGEMESALGRSVSASEALGSIVNDLVSTQGKQLEGALVGQQASVVVNEAQQALANSASAINKEIAKTVGTTAQFNTLLESISTALETTFDPATLNKTAEDFNPFSDMDLSGVIQSAIDTGSITKTQGEKALEYAAVVDDLSATTREREAAMQKLRDMDIGLESTLKEFVQSTQVASDKMRDEALKSVEATGGVERKGGNIVGEDSFFDRLSDWYEGSWLDRMISGDDAEPSDPQPSTTPSTTAEPVNPQSSNAAVNQTNAVAAVSTPDPLQLDSLNQSIALLNQTIQQQPVDDNKKVVEKLDEVKNELVQLANINKQLYDNNKKQLKTQKNLGSDLYGIS